jgi:DNA polymerase (family X)
VRLLARPVDEILAVEGVEGLRKLTGIGDRLAIAIRDIIRIGRIPMLDRLRGEADPVDLLETVPGIGPVHAARLHDELSIDSLEDLEAVAHDGRLCAVAGLGGQTRLRNHRFIGNALVGCAHRVRPRRMKPR